MNDILIGYIVCVKERISHRQLDHNEWQDLLNHILKNLGCTEEDLTYGSELSMIPELAKTTINDALETSKMIKNIKETTERKPKN